MLTGALLSMILLSGRPVASPSLPTMDRAQRQARKPARDRDPDEEVPSASELAPLRKPKVRIFDYDLALGVQPSGDGEWETFHYVSNIENESAVQIAEIDTVLTVIQKKSGKEIYRTKPNRTTQFTNLNVPHVGAMEPFSIVIGATSGDYRIPSNLWRTDTRMVLKVTGLRAVADTHDLHDIGNLNEFMMFHHTSEVEKAILKDPSILKARNRERTTPLLVAMAHGTPRLARFMIAHGADIHATGRLQEDAMFYAASGNRPKMLDFALSQGFSVDPPAVTPIRRATLLVANRAVKWLIAHGANINRADMAGNTPIAIAITQGCMEPFKLLLAAKADLHCHTNKGLGLMHLATRNEEYLPYLVKAGLPVDDPTPRLKLTPLMWAAGNQYDEASKWLLKHGANINAKDTRGYGVLEYARGSNTLRTDAFFREAVGDLKKYGYK